ncbi:MAG: glutathione S-transferase family protein [Proteobacteria bacterium]|nr:glutathione S-transferase family protein [Pseudomonadota bacterium]
MAEIEFITAEVCPFAQRTHLALIEKGLEYDHAEVDLKNKPAWFEAVSPYSKVPVFKHDGAVIYESAIINEYIEERFPEPALMPSDPKARAMARIWIDYCNTRFIGAFYGALSAQGPDAQAEAAAKLTDMMIYMEDAGLSPLGSDPYWLGSDVSLVDLAYWPFFERLPAVTHYRGVDIPARCPRLAAWIVAMGTRESVRRTRHDAAYYIDSYARYDAPAAAQ